MAFDPAFKTDGFQWKACSFKRMPAFFVLLFLAVCLFMPLSSARAEGGNPRYASLVMDADTGQILYQRYADKSLHPASLVKMMTLLMAFEAIENGKLSLRDRVTVSRHAASMSPSKLDLPAGSSIRVEDAVYALVTKSANDVAVALGEKIGGTESHFADMMTERAREIGMNGTRFKNASGLHNAAQVTTARDMARLARFIIGNYPRYYEYFSTRQFTYMGQTYRNHNRLMETYPGMDGMKTGFIGASGFNLVASAQRNGHRLIGVVFGGQTASSRNAHMKKLLDNGFNDLNVLMAQARPPAPVPDRKPGKAVALASAGDGASSLPEDARKWASIKPMLQSQSFRALIGEGDYDPAETRRFETGMAAINAIKGLHQVSLPEQSQTAESWSIQVGAFESRIKTDQAIRNARKRLDADLAQAQAVIVPLRTQEGVLFRGRLGGYSKEQALRACGQISDCLPVSPQAQ